MKKVPAKYSRCGIKVKCLKCGFLVTDVCKSTNKGIGSCEHKERHKYIFIVQLKDSYIAEEFIAGNLANFSVFGNDKIIQS